MVGVSKRPAADKWRLPAVMTKGACWWAKFARINWPIDLSHLRVGPFYRAPRLTPFLCAQKWPPQHTRRPTWPQFHLGVKSGQSIRVPGVAFLLAFLPTFSSLFLSFSSSSLARSKALWPKEKRKAMRIK